MLLHIDPKKLLLLFNIFHDCLLSILNQVNVSYSYNGSDNSGVVAVTLLFIRCLCRIIPATKLLYSLSHFW
jgi:hypothetical protein